MILIGVLSFGVSLYNFIAAVVDYTTLNKEIKIVDDLERNWREFGYDSFKVQTTYPCTEGYDNIAKYYWNGTESGCNCGG